MEPEYQSSTVTCASCKGRLRNPQLLPCIHVFCLACLTEFCVEKNPDKYLCPLCSSADSERKPQSARPWHSFDRILENESVQEELQRRLAELPPRERSGSQAWEEDSDSDESSENVSESGSRRSSVLPPPTCVFPCSVHTERTADSFCLRCEQTVCPRCVSSFHRRCQNFVALQDAVEVRRSVLDSVQAQVAEQLVASQNVEEFQAGRVKDIEEMRTQLLLQVKSFRTELVNLVLAKEKALSAEVNRLADSMRSATEDRQTKAGNLAKAFHRQLDVLDLSISIHGEGELLSYLPYMVSKLKADENTVAELWEDGQRAISFSKDERCLQVVNDSPLGTLSVSGVQHLLSEVNPASGCDVKNLKLVLANSFHGGTRDDVTDPLLTDLVLLANGDVILTDRDNKCVKKFNPSGKLLTRVLIDAIPSRIAAVSQARAVVSVMNKKALYFLSLHGTVRVLNTVRVKKLYSFLTSLGNGVLVAGTSHCDTIDVLTDRGQLVRCLYSQRADRASIARPLYLTPAVPYSQLSKSGSSHEHHHQQQQKQQQDASVSRSQRQTNGGGAGKRTQAQTDPTKDLDIDVLVSDSGKRVLFGLQQDGSVTFTFKSKADTTLACPLGVTVHDCGLTLLADRDADCVWLLDRQGAPLQRILTSAHGLLRPCGLYAGVKGQVALSQVDGWVKVYKQSRD